MCKGGSSSSTIDPRIMSMLQQNYASAQNVANRVYQPYTGQLTAGLTPSQQEAGSLLQSAPIVGQGAFNTGINAAAQGTQYETPQVSSGFYNPAMAESGIAGPPALMSAAPAHGFNPAQAAQIDAGTLPFVSAPNGLAQLSGYINPYTQNVVDAAMNELNRQNRIALNAVNQNAAAENAFGGDRQAVAQALTNDDYARAKANEIANLNSQGFNAAAGLLQNNQQMGLQAGSNSLNAALQAAGQNAGYSQGANLANASALNNLGELNAAMQQQANQANAGAENQANLLNAAKRQAVNLANAGAANSASQFDLNNWLQTQVANQNAANAAQGLDLQGAGLLGTLGTAQNSNYLNGVNALNSWGTQAQQTEQNALNAAYQQYLNQFNYPVQMQQLLNSALSGGMGAGTYNPVAAGQATGGLLGGLGSLGSAAALLLPLL